MNNEQDFLQEFMEDYLAECDEHLSNVRHQLLALESLVNQPNIDTSIIGELFRSFHTIKGLSGMVGIQEAEALAHEMESYLRILRDEQVIFQSDGFSALMEGTKALENVINSVRNHDTLHDITIVLRQLQALNPQSQELISSSTTNSDQIELKQPESTELETPKPEYPKKWHFVFSPHPELAARDINVNTIRSRLQAIGNLVHSAPRLTQENKIVFDFLVVTQEQETTFQPWREDGLSWELSESQGEWGVGSREWGVEQKSEIPTKETIELENEQNQPDKLENLPTETITESVSNTQPPLITHSSNVVRVDLAKLDELMRMVGDLVISRAKLEDNLKHLQNNINSSQRRSLKEINLTLERQLRDLREGVMRVRLVPIGDAFARMQFVVRDLLRESNKKVLLEVTGQETEIDKFVVERMMDPLLHLVRNAISHGIETTSEREKIGKPLQGKISLRAKTTGENVIIEIEDDGKGIDLDKVIECAKNKGLISEQKDSTNYDLLTILDLLCSPGFSTKEQADLVSGRGVGMTIVQNIITELGGLLNLRTEKNQGTCYTIQLPLTLAIADALIISLGEQTFAIPQTSVREVTDLQISDITAFENYEIFTYRDKVLSLVRLGKYFGIDKELLSNSPRLDNEKYLRVVIIGNELNAIGIVIDRVIGLREIVVRPLTDPYVQVPGIAGATELGDGRVVLILDVSALIRTAGKMLELRSQKSELRTQNSELRTQNSELP
jgi:two-component system chemotaxis sensor kinase CheA